MHSTLHWGVHQGLFFIFKKQTFTEYSIVNGIIFIRQTKNLKPNQAFLNLQQNKT
jgi:hypothetical protein